MKKKGEQNLINGNNKYEHKLFRKSFIDRDDVLKTINTEFSSYNEGVLKKKVFLLIGISGIGKTKLINQIAKIYNDVFNEEQLIQITTHMEILGEETAIAILQKVRENIVQAPLFDYTFLKYWELSKVSQLDTKYLRILADSLPVEIASDLLSLVNTAVPFLGTGLSIGTSIISKIIKKGNHYYTRIFDKNGLSYTKNLIDAYVMDDPVKILPYLPELLAIDMENHAGDKKQLYIFDAYDKATKYMLDGIEWLKLLVKSFKSGIFIITSRENLRWCAVDFNNTLEVMHINEIPEIDVYNALNEYGVPDAAAQKIVSLTQCIPIYLDLALFVYEKEGIDGLNALSHHKKEDFAAKLINHLSEDMRWIVKIFSIIQFVDVSVYNEMLAVNQLSSLKNPFDDFISTTLVSYIEKFESFYKVHDVLASDIGNMLPLDLKQRITAQFIEITKRNIYKNKANDNYMLICKCLQLGNTLYIKIRDQSKYPSLSDSLVELCHYLIENGFCDDLYKYFKSLSISETSPVYAPWCFSSAMYYRNNSISKGLAILNKMDFKFTWLNRQQKLFECETIYLDSISGNYYDVEKKLREFYRSLRKNERDSVYFTKGCLYHADMLMLRGQFIDAIELMQEIGNIQIEQASFTYFEIQKAIGHCYRFNWMFTSALRYYNSFSGHYAESLRMEAYRLTTECETYCFSDYHRTFEFSEEAITKNTMLRNSNNLGKIYCALCIAYLQEKKYSHAKEAVAQAHKLFSTTQYESGTFFAYIAEVFLRYAEKKIISSALIKKVNRQLERICNVYSYLLLPVYILINNDESIERLKKENQWINFEETVKAIDNFIRRL